MTDKGSRKGAPPDAKPTGPATETEVRRFVEKRSSFDFEMRVLSLLRFLGYECEHAGNYIDPLTRRLRAFDIRARKRLNNETLEIRLAVECKAVRHASPVIVYATPRRSEEAYVGLLCRHSFAHAVHGPPLAPQVAHPSRSYNIAMNSRVYPVNDPVGREIDQPANLRGDVDEQKSSDAETYDKWRQAVNGTAELLKQCVRAARESPPVPTAIVPMLVVPDGALWQVDYDAVGAVCTPARAVESATLRIGHVWSEPFVHSAVDLDISHLEIVTIAGVAQRLAEFEHPTGPIARFAFKERA